MKVVENEVLLLKFYSSTINFSSFMKYPKAGTFTPLLKDLVCVFHSPGGDVFLALGVFGEKVSAKPYSKGKHR